MKSLEADLLKTAAKEAKDNLVGKAANTMLISASYQEKDEKQLRDKLVTKLKQKAEDREVGLLIIIGSFSTLTDCYCIDKKN